MHLCIGNRMRLCALLPEGTTAQCPVRTGVQALHEYRTARDREELRRSGLYFGVILFFALGAVLGNLLVCRYGLSAIRWDCLLLLLPLLLMLRHAGAAPEEMKI